MAETDEEKFAPDLVKALKESGKEVPYALQEMADDFGKKRDQGLVQARGSGFGGSGFKFDEEEEERKKQARKMLMAAQGEGKQSVLLRGKFGELELEFQI